MNPKPTCNSRIYKSVANGGVPCTSASNATNLNVSAAALSTAAAVAAMSAQQQSHATTTVTMQPPQHNSNTALVPATTLNLPSRAGTPMTGVAAPVANKSNMTTTTTPFPAPINPGVRLPQHLVMSSVNHQFPPTTATSVRLTEQQRVPPIFQNMGLRRGKWNPEEEHFANALIEEFEKGTIQDCENGCTLRAFLSRKLHCAPMRISKKYAGKSIGKHVFLSRTITPGQGVGPAAVQNNSEKLRQLEFQFHMSLLQEGASGGVNPASMTVGQPLRIFGNEINLLTAVPPGVSLAPTHFFQNGAQLQGTLLNFPTLGAQPIPAPLQWPVSLIPQTSTGTSQMQQSLHNAYRDALSSSNNVGTTTIPTPNTTIANVPAPALAVAMPTIHTSNDQINGVQAKETHSRSVALEPNPIPNLVTGFDQLKQNGCSNVATSDKTQADATQQQWNDYVNAIPSLEPSVYNMGGFSPTFTSKSFDDLHQFIGKDCSNSTDDNGGENAQSTHVKQETVGLALNDSASNTYDQNKQIKVETHGLTTNESSSNAYALFAQQSAIAVSKHSAYCRNDQALPPQNATNPSISQSLCPSNQLSLSHCIPSESQVPPQIKEKVSNGTAFSTANLKIHSKAAEEMARADQASHCTTASESNDTVSLQPVTNGADFNRNNMLRGHSNIVSGSERTDSAGGSSGVNSSASGSCTGSDNASDNSDSLSDEGRLASHSRKRTSKESSNDTYTNNIATQAKRPKHVLEEERLSQ